jgi:hypothetical protein
MAAKKISEKHPDSIAKPKNAHVLYKAAKDFDLAAYQNFNEDPISFLVHAKKGLDAKSALDFIYLSGFTASEFQETFKTTVKTIQNYFAKELKLDAALSEKLLKSFALFDKGILVFGSVKEFQKWLYISSYGLGNLIPFEMMDTITGINLIEEELIRIEHGDLA